MYKYRRMNNLTTNRNYLSPTGFKVVINSQEFSNLEYFCTHATVPGISLTPVNMPWRGNQNRISGDRIEYPAFTMKFMVSENMENYIEIFNWMKLNSVEATFKKCDVILHIMSSHNNTTKRIRYVDAFPTSLGELELHTQNTDVEYVTLDAQLEYTYFEFI